MNANTKVWSLVALQLVLVAGLFGARSFTVLTGEEVVLETAPVDPRDLFRGDYATLSYEISTLTVTTGTYTGGDRVYVRLGPEAGTPYHHAVSVHHGRPALDEGQVCLRGQVQWVNEDRAGQQTLQVEYGIESYFIPEGAGDPPRDATIDARVAVDRFCTGVVTAVLVDGEPWDPSRNAGR